MNEAVITKAIITNGCAKAKAWVSFENSKVEDITLAGAWDVPEEEWDWDKETDWTVVRLLGKPELMV